jgi:hypothetical protein
MKLLDPRLPMRAPEHRSGDRMKGRKQSVAPKHRLSRTLGDCPQNIVQEFWAALHDCGLDTVKFGIVFVSAHCSGHRNIHSTLRIGNEVKVQNSYFMAIPSMNSSDPNSACSVRAMAAALTWRRGRRSREKKAGKAQTKNKT